MRGLGAEDATTVSTRYSRKRERIVDAASRLINQQGVKGLTFVSVAQAVDLNTTSVTYYFKRKDLLAAAAFEHALAQIDRIATQAGREADPRARVRRYVSLNIAYRAQLRADEARPVATLSDLRALEEPLRADLAQRYQQVFRKVRDFFGTAETPRQGALNTARAHVLTEIFYWFPIWEKFYSIQDFARVEARMTELFETGFAPKDAAWAPARLDLYTPASHSPDEAGFENFLRAATRLINERGYRGASVERIASELNVTKGSFYHHLNAKDDLVLECFDRSYNRVSTAQRSAIAAEGSYWQRASSAIAALLRIQFEDHFPLLRTTALQALPAVLQEDVVERSNRMARRFAGMLIDGISEGSIRAIDPLIASQSIMAVLNAAFDLRRWAAAMPLEDAVAIYATPLAYGLFADAPEPG